MTNRKYDLTCIECLKETMDSYMVLNTLWDFAVPEKKGVMHLKCLEKRLKRSLAIEDFSDYPINDGIRFGFLMARKELE